MIVNQRVEKSRSPLVRNEMTRSTSPPRLREYLCNGAFEVYLTFIRDFAEPSNDHCLFKGCEDRLDR